MAHFFAMGGYAAFVWPSYALSVLGVGALIGFTIRDYRRAKRHLAEIEGEARR